MAIKWTIHTDFEHHKLDIVCNEAALTKIHLRIGLGDFFVTVSLKNWSPVIERHVFELEKKWDLTVCFYSSYDTLGKISVNFLFLIL